MKSAVVWCYALLALLLCSAALADVQNVKPPQTYVYTRYPPKNGEPNQLICHCTGFHPPKISMTLLADGKEIADCEPSDLTFKDDWSYYITKHGKITYQKGTSYTCEVQHNDGEIKRHNLEDLM